MGKGGGGGGPQVSTAYQTNLPEYAKPYVMNMLGAAQNQLFETKGDEITGFRPYTPYSTDPTQYFAGPSSLQQSTYNEAGQMQTPGQFNAATGLAGMSGMGQLGTAGQAGMYGQRGAGLGMYGAMQAAPAFGAGQQFASQVTNPNSMAQYMSPYQQQVTDIAKADAVRNAQLAQQQANLGSARQGTYGGARQALMQGEREKNLLANLSNIQAQGSQSAFDKAMQTQQFGANLGLQGIQTGLQGLQTGMQGIGQGLQGVGAQQAGYAGAGQAASTLGSLGGQQQQSDLARINLQNQLGQQQQQYQQGIINQSIQDYATAQQYPYMQLSTMSNLLRGLPMQGMTTQQYQAQPSALQQGIGLLGTGASLYGAMKREGGAIKEYKAGGSVGLGYANRGQVDSMRDRLEEMFATDPEDTAKYVAQSTSPSVKKLGRELGIGAAPVGKLGTNMAGGGIIAFEEGGNVPGFYEGELIGGDYDYGQSGYGTLFGSTRAGLAKERADEERKLKEEFLAKNAPEALVAMRKREADAKSGMTESSFKDFDQAQALFEKERNTNKPPAAPAAAPAAAPVSNQETGIAKALAEQNRLYETLGITPGMGEKTRGLMDYINEGKERRQSEAGQDRYLRMAKAFAQFGSTSGPFMSSASKALGGFAEGEAGAQKELRAADLADKKMAADLEKAQRAEAKGDFATAQKSYDSAANREVQREGHLSSAKASMYGADREERLVERAMKDPEFGATLKSVKGYDERGNLVNATAKILESKYPDYKLVAMIPEAKRTKEQKEYLENAYKNAETEARRLSSAKPTGTSAEIPTTVAVGNKSYKRSDYPNMTDKQWSEYVNSVKG